MRRAEPDSAAAPRWRVGAISRRSLESRDHAWIYVPLVLVLVIPVVLSLLLAIFRRWFPMNVSAHPDPDVIPEEYPAPGWRVWVDTGGTFTDCVALDPAGRLHRTKVLSTSALRGTVAERAGDAHLRVRADWMADAEQVRGFEFRLLGLEHDPLRVESVAPEQSALRLSGELPDRVSPGAPFELRSPEEAPVLAARLVTRTAPPHRLPPLAMRLATTRGTNALLERRGQPPVLFITQGFRDLLRIGTQQRPDLFALDIRRPEPLFGAVVEVPERLAADGSVVAPLALDELTLAAERLLSKGFRTAAVALLHSHRNPVHEAQLEARLRELGFQHVSRASALAPFIKLLHRAETAVVDAYLAPVIAGYLANVRAALAGPPMGRGAGSEIRSPKSGIATLHVMTSAGGLVRAEGFSAKDSLLSGPAGGVVGAALAGRRAGHARVIAFDMGGTSTDVARIDGDFDYVWEHSVGDARLVAPALAIESVAAGGGSICSLDEDGLRVGPESAGAWPGPACYGAGGPLTLTDANLLLGRLDPSSFGIPLDPAAARARFEALREALAARTGEEPAPEALLEGMLALADERMADAIRRISLRKGYDPAEYALVAFGGAGPQHACGVAARLGIATIIVPADAGLLSALGIGHAVIERFAERQVLMPLDEVASRIPGWLDELAGQARAAVEAEGVPAEEVEVRRRILGLRYLGQEASLELEWQPTEPLASAFERRYRETYGHTPEQRAIELESLRVIASARPVEELPLPSAIPHEAVPAGAGRDLPAYDRPALRPGAQLRGPALIRESHSATVVDAGWTAELHASGALLLQRSRGAGEQESGAAREQGSLGAGGVSPPLLRPPTPPRGGGSGAVEAVREELFIHRFEALVGEMGEQLRRTALSVNVRERLDFSCALLDAGGELVANAPHIPVHLGALGLCVREVARALPLAAGDVAVTNHPAFGGSHLPDVTLIAPVHDAGGALLGFVANRAHHAELGGARPGSMPPAARTLAEEGVVIPPLHLVRGGAGGAAEWAALRERLASGEYPSRAVDDNLADLRAQAAAAHRGAELLRRVAAAHGADAVAHYMRALTGRAERRVREALRRIADGAYAAEERLDDGSVLAVRIEISDDSAVFDFAGSAGVHPGNLNATPAIVRSVSLYVLRLLIGEALPLNEGLLRAVELRIPPGILDPAFPADPRRAPAVVGGNVETSQRLVDTLLRALGLAACSQGTMNNVLFGNARFGYYETVCGGAGAGPGWHGASAVHTHMTNTRITDPEVLEHRYPVRVERFALRPGSGGAGRWRGGDGAVRELRFLEPVSLSVLTQHRRERPYGMQGGEPGRPGRQRVVRASGEVVDLASIDGADLETGDRLVLETPGGGGWGDPSR
jgi:5-oxoprolinase (ATP-hydrolysing)